MFFAVTKAISIAVRLVRVRAVRQFFTVVDTIAVTVGLCWVGASQAFFGVGETIAIAVTRGVRNYAFTAVTVTFGSLLVV